MNRTMGTAKRYGADVGAGGARLRLVGRGVAIASTALLHSAAAACPSCYGESSGPVIDGMNLAVLLMIGVTGGVFSWIISFAVRISRRERRLAGEAAGNPTERPGPGERR